MNGISDSDDFAHGLMELRLAGIAAASHAMN